MTWLALRTLGGKLIGLLSRVPLWAWALALALAWGALQRHHAIAAGKAQIRAEQALRQFQADAAKAAIDQLARDVATQQEAIHAATTERDAARADADALADSVRRLRDRAAHAGSRPAAPAAGGSASAAAGPDVCADVRGRLAAAVGELAARGQRLAEIADKRGIAGRVCERIGTVNP